LIINWKYYILHK